MTFKIYTKTGDLGKTSLIGGTKVLKSNIRIESYGSVDELNSHIGFLSDVIGDEKSILNLREIQDRLFTIGSTLACDPEKDTKMKIPDLHEEDIIFLENEMDKMNEVLPEMRSFLLPGGHISVSAAHIARCVCRRAERVCVRMQEEKYEISPIIIKYLNRLSDYLFILSRYSGHLHGAKEIPWKARV